MVGRRTIELPDKVYFRIGEVAQALELRPHVVRFWQKEFPSIRPERSRSGRFLYTRTTVEHIALIRTLLHDEGYTIQGARKAIRERSRNKDSEATVTPSQSELEDALAALQARHDRLCDAVAREGARVLTLLGESAGD